MVLLHVHGLESGEQSGGQGCMVIDQHIDSSHGPRPVDSLLRAIVSEKLKTQNKAISRSTKYVGAIR